MPERKAHFKFTDEEISKADKGDARVHYQIYGGEFFVISKLQFLFVDRKDDSDPVHGSSYDKRDLTEFGSAKRFSPWISNGCLSIRYYFHEFCKILDQWQVPDFKEECMRGDFYRYWSMRNGGSLMDVTEPWMKKDEQLITRWK